MTANKLDWSELIKQVKTYPLLGKTMTANIVGDYPIDYSGLLLGKAKGAIQTTYLPDDLIETKIMLDRAMQLYHAAQGRCEKESWSGKTTLTGRSPINIRQYLFVGNDDAYFAMEKVMDGTIFGEVHLVVDEYSYDLNIHRSTGMGIIRQLIGYPDKSKSTIDNLHGELLDFMEDYMVDDNGHE